MNKIKKRVERTELEGDAGGGMVRVKISGKMRVVSVAIEPTLIAEGDVHMIEDLVASATNGALRKAQDLMVEEMKSITGGMTIPGLS